MPVFDQAVLEGWGHHDDVVGAFIEKASDSGQGVMQQRIFGADTDGGEGFGPEIADFENEGDLTGESDPPSGEADKELGRSGDDHIGTWESESAECGREAKGCVVAHAFVGFAIGQRPEPGAEDFHAADFLLIGEAAQAGAPFRGDNTCGMIRKPGENGDIVPGLRPVLCEFGGTGGGGAHLGREVLGDVEDFHAKVEGIANEECLR